MKLVPTPSEQCVVLGQTGRGKSSWIKKLITPYFGKRQQIIIDVKHDDIWDKYGVSVGHPNDLMRLAKDFQKYPSLIYRPEGDLAKDYEAYDDIFSWIYDRWHTLVVVDETSAIVKNAIDVGRGLNDITTRGRKREITRIFGSQRPTGCPRVIFSESSKFFVKAIIDKRDRDTVAGFSDERMKEPIEDTYGMKYCDTKTGFYTYFPKVPL